MKQYHKLIRDNIPNIIESKGGKAEIRILSDEEYPIYLEAKLDEEVGEYHRDKTAEELADILEKRIAEAKQLLRNTTTGVTQVGEQCGFSGVYHFCRAFKKRVGITPTQYAEQNRIFKL